MRWYAGNIPKILKTYVAFNQDAISFWDIKGINIGHAANGAKDINIFNNIITSHKGAKDTVINHNQM